MKVDYAAHKIREIGEETNIIGEVHTDGDDLWFQIIDPQTEIGSAEIADELIRLASESDISLTRVAAPDVLILSVPGYLPYTEVTRMLNRIGDAALAAVEISDNRDTVNDTPWDI
jgi:hypothetical protein